MKIKRTLTAIGLALLALISWQWAANIADRNGGQDVGIKK